MFHSLSKRSSVPGLRSGFVAGDSGIIKPYLLYRTYHGCAMPVPTQLASIAAWNDDAHAAANRTLYREKYASVLPILQPVLDVVEPDGAFYLWPDVQRDDETFTRDCSRRRISPSCPAATSRATPVQETPADNASAFRWSRRWTNASPPRSASGVFWPSSLGDSK